MLLPRHRPDKENQVHRLPKTPGPSKSIIHKVPPKTPFNDENYLLPRTGKKSVVFGQSTTNPDHSKFDAFQTPAPRRVLGGKDLNTRQTPFHAPPSTIKPFNNAQGTDAWSPPFTRPTHRRHSRKSSLGLRISPVKDSSVKHMDVEEIEYMPPTPQDIPFEPADWEPIDWEAFKSMKQDLRSYFIKVDEFGKSDMDYWIEEKMDFGKDEELPVVPAPVKAVKPLKLSTKGKAVAATKWAPTKPMSNVRTARPIDRSNNGRITGSRAAIKPDRSTVTPAKSKREKFVRDEMRDEVLALEMEELALCKDDDYGTAFDLEL